MQQIFKKNVWLPDQELWKAVRLILRAVYIYRVTQKKYSCLIKCKRHNRRGIFKNDIFCAANKVTQISIHWFFIFGCHLAEI